MQRLMQHCQSKDPYADLQLPEPSTARPYVLMNMVSSVDGKATVGGSLQPGSLGSRTDRFVMDCIRSHVDAVICGSSTIRNHAHYLGVRRSFERLRTDRGLEPQPLTIIMTNSGELPLESPLFQEAPRRPIVLGSNAVSLEHQTAIQTTADFVSCGQEAVDVSAALQILRQQFAVKWLLVEGGPKVNYQFFQSLAVDEVFWTAAPLISGGQLDLTMVMGPEPLRPIPRLNLQSVFCEASELFLRYTVEYDPPSNS